MEAWSFRYASFTGVRLGWMVVRKQLELQCIAAVYILKALKHSPSHAGADECCSKTGSFSKCAGFTGVRLDRRFPPSRHSVP